MDSNLSKHTKKFENDIIIKETFYQTSEVYENQKCMLNNPVDKTYPKQFD